MLHKTLVKLFTQPLSAATTRIFVVGVLLSLLAVMVVLFFSPGPLAVFNDFQSPLVLHPSIIIVGSVACVSIFLTRRIVTGLFLGGAVAALVVTSSLLKLHYLGIPLAFADVVFFVANLSDNAVLFSTYPNLGILLLLSLVLIFGVTVVLYRRENPYRFWVRWASLAVAFVSLTTNASALEQTIDSARTSTTAALLATPPNALHRFLGDQFWGHKNYKENPETSLELLDYFFLVRRNDPEIPPPHPAAAAFRNMDTPAAEAPSTAQLPDIFAVLHESLFNPTILSDCATNAACQSGLFSPDNRWSSLHGPLFVHQFGGGTWLSEFAFMTGFDWRIFGKGGAYAPINLASRSKSLAQHLRQLGYRTVAVYPVAGNFINARRAYADYGFEEFYATEDIGISTQWRETDDAVVFRKAMEVIARKDDGRPLFVFVLTIKNHGPHARSHSELPDRSDLKGVPPSLADFLIRMHESEAAMAKLKETWLGEKRKRLLLWFGDHQPKLPGDPMTNPEFMTATLPASMLQANLRMTTWYEISANFPLRASPAVATQSTDLAYLSTLMLSAASIPPQSHDPATLYMSARCPNGLLIQCPEGLTSGYLSFRIHDLGDIR